MLKHLIIFILVLFFPMAVRAEWQNAVQNPQMQIVPQDAFKILDANISISNDKLSVAYTMQSWLNGDVLVQFDLLPYAWFGDVVIYLDRSFSELDVSLNEKKIEYNKRYNALIGNKDITDDLEKSGISPTILNDYSKWIQDSADNRKQYADMLAKNYMINVPDHQYIPRWWVHPYYWFSFSGKSDVPFKLEYQHTILWGADSFKVSEMKKNEKSIFASLLQIKPDEFQKIFSKLGLKDDAYCKLTQTRIPWVNIAKLYPIKNISIQLVNDSKKPQIIFLRISDKYIYSTEKTLSINLTDIAPQEDLWVVIFSQ
ncbi:DUF4424 family protein [Desulfovibrio litoralis]|uniref:DUF4424 domain-containing protein n=1 Tax=Desulfovibrio litoralis DSM 11393 TaxID=1121455 RepID=A0A1M7SGZ2_9BACT|nr:DUF4424 family protein [Desulfovibrio litoralis]SHN57714.1 protein of unknown function [Desulfovibrio litoralis DSM 11393]